MIIHFFQQKAKQISVDLNYLFFFCWRSKDKIFNKDGEMLMAIVENKGLVILNGVMDIDTVGGFTHISARRKSIIDYFGISVSMLNYIRSMS